MIEIIFGVYFLGIFIALFFLGFTRKLDLFSDIIGFSVLWPLVLPFAFGYELKEYLEKKRKKEEDMFL